MTDFDFAFFAYFSFHLASDISLWVNNDWEIMGPFAVALEEDEPIE